MAEVFKVWGTFALHEENGPIDQKIDNITNAARESRIPLGRLGDSLDDVSEEMNFAGKSLNNLQESFDDAGKAAKAAAKPIEDVGAAADDSENPIDTLTGSLDELGGVAGITAGIIAGAFVAAMADGMQYSKDLNNALDDLQRKTGENDKAMQGYKDSMENLFKQGFTNDINSISEAFNIAAVQTDLTGEKLESFTKKVMFLSERLGTDYGETIKTIDGMVRDYGITHDEAFDIISKGFDENLNVAGDLLDLFSEYGPILQKIGFDENDMLSILVSSREKGIFSYDELLDGVKEFQIKMFELLQDEKASKEFFEDLGLKASDVKKAFTEGGEAAAEMSGLIAFALSEIEDPIEQSKIGVELYGTKWEDTSGKINDVMINSRARFIDTKESMDKLIETDTEPLSEEWNKFYNKYKADTLEPLGEALNDISLKFLKWMNDSNDYITDGFDDMTKTMRGWNKSMEDGFSDLVDLASEKMDKFGDVLWNAGQKAGDLFFDVISGLVDDVNSDLESISGFADSVANAFDNLGGKISNVIKKIGNINFPSKPSWIPGFATGVDDFSGGLAMVGERGPELVYLPPHSNVYSNQDTNNMLGNLRDNKSTINNLSTISTSGGNTYNINMSIAANDIKSISDLLDLFKNIKSEYISQ